MNKDDVLATLRAHEAELKRAGIARLSVFGSVARGETGNDVDRWHNSAAHHDTRA